MRSSFGWKTHPVAHSVHVSVVTFNTEATVRKKWVWPQAVKYSLISLCISFRETDSSASVETISRPRKLWETKVTVTLRRKITSPPRVERNIWLRLWIYANRSELVPFMHDLWVLTGCIPTCEMTAFHKKCVVFFILFLQACSQMH